MKIARLIIVLAILFNSASPVYSQRSNLFQLQFNKKETDSLLNRIEKTNNDREKVDLYRTICWKLRNTNAEDKALDYADEGIELAKKIGYKKGQADITRFKGLMSWNFKRQSVSYDLYTNALALSKEIGDREGEAYCYDRFGITAYYNKKFEDAEKYFNKAFAIFTELKTKEGLAYLYSHYNWLYSEEKMYNLAIEAGLKAIDWRIQLHDEEGTSNALADMGITYQNINRDSAFAYVIKSVELARAKQMELPLAEHTILLSAMYMKEKENDKALQYATESYELARENNSKRQIQKTAQIIAKLYEQLHNYPKAIQFFHIFHDISDSLFNEEINKKIVEKEMDYRYEKEKQIASEKARLTKVVLTSAIILIIFVAVMIFLRYRVTQVLKVEELRRKISSDLHDDIGATLSSINIYSELAKKVKDNTEYIKTIQQHAINTVGNLDDLVWSINPNNDNLGVLIERMRSYALPLLGDNHIHTEFNADIKDSELSITLEKRRSIYFAFKEMVANVLKHANSTSCCIKLAQNKSSFCIEIVDNGKGFDFEKINQQRNGLRNLKNRANENGGKFTVNTGLGVGTKCVFEVSLKQQSLHIA